MQQNKINQPPKPNYPLRRILGVGGAVLALVGAKDVATTTVNAVRGTEYTAQQLQALPHKPAIIDSGQGADEAIAKVEPAVLDNPEQRFEVENAISRQGQGPNHELMSGQQVEVPIIPGNSNPK